MKITESIHAIKHDFIIPISPAKKLERYVYSFVLFGKEKVLLVDSGVASSEKTITNYIKDHGFSLSDVETLILTHSHPDHIGSAQKIKEKTDCQVLAHEGEKQWIQNIDQQFAERPVPGFNSLVTHSVQIDGLIKDNDLIKITGVPNILSLHTPGHSRGSISLQISKEKVLITADSIIMPGTLPIYDDVYTSISSINKLRNIENIDWMLSSWDNPRTGEETSNIFEQSINYLKSIHYTVRTIAEPAQLQPMSLCEKVVLEMGLPQVAVNPLVARSLQSHLQYLDMETME